MTFESEKELGGSYTIKLQHQGEFNLKEITSSMLKWLDDKGYFVKFKDQTESIKPEGKDTIYEWNCDRQPIPYIKFYIDVLIYTFHMNDIIIEEDGKKRKVQSGDLHITVKGFWRKNYNKVFPDSRMGEFLRRAYERYVAFSRLKMYWGKIYGEIIELNEVAKKALSYYQR